MGFITRGRDGEDIRGKVDMGAVGGGKTLKGK
jgi:hypothetical protein